MHTRGLAVLHVKAIIYKYECFEQLKNRMNYFFVKKVGFFFSKCLMQMYDANAWCKIELLLARSELKWLLMHLRAYEQKQVCCWRTVFKMQERFCQLIWISRKAFKIRESFGKLLQSGKAWESFLSFVY